MNHDHPPLIAVPESLCDRDAATLLAFLYELAGVIESLYAAQLQREHPQTDSNQLSLLDDPPF